MRKGFTLPLTIAVVLSVSSAMALGPTIQAVPDVYITSATTTLTPDVAPGYNVFRYSNALVLWDYVKPGDTTTSAAIYWAYALKDATLAGGTGSFVTGSGVNYQIGTVSAFAPTNPAGTSAWVAEVDAAATQKVSEAGALTFRDIRISPLPDTTGVYTPSRNPGLASSVPANYLDLQEATLFVTDKATTPGTDTILVASVTDGVDRLSGGLKWTTDKTWADYTAGGAWAFGTFATLAPFPASPGTGTVGASSMTITCPLASVEYFGQVATAGGSNDFAANVSNLYRMTVTLASTNTNVQSNPMVRISLNGKTSGAGQGQVEFPQSAGTQGPTTTPASFNAFLWPAASGNFTPTIMCYDAATNRGGTITVSNVKISSVPKADLLASANTVLKDVGAGGADGAFTGIINAVIPFGATLSYSGVFNATGSDTGTALTSTFSPAVAAGQGGLVAHIGGSFNNLFTTHADKLVVVKVHLTASSDSGLIPDPRFYASRAGENMNAEFLITRAGTSGPTTAGTDMCAVFQTGAAGSATVGAFDLNFQALGLVAGQVGSITVTRVTVTEYGIPSE